VRLRGEAKLPCGDKTDMGCLAYPDRAAAAAWGGKAEAAGGGGGGEFISHSSTVS
jgi:hypothetical protein